MSRILAWGRTLVAAVVAGAALTAATPAVASIPAGHARGFEDCAHVPPAAPRGVTAEQQVDLNENEVVVSWGPPVDVQLGTTCGPVTGYFIENAFASGDCPRGHTEPWEIGNADQTLDPGTRSDTFIEISRGWYAFRVIAATPAGWGTWSPWSPVFCLGDQLP
jgi:hypothetical protein